MDKQRSSIAIAAIDDDETILDAIKTVLDDPQWNVRTYATGEEFVADLKYHTPECVLLDVCLPDLSSVDVARLIHSEHPFIPIVVLTAYDSSPLTDKLKKMDIAGVLIKPVSAETLIESIQSAINYNTIPVTKP